MARDFFDDRVDLIPEKREAYKPGEGNEEFEVAKKIVKEYLEVLRTDPHPYRRKMDSVYFLEATKGLDERILNDSELDRQVFLDAMVRSIEKEDAEDTVYVDDLLVPFINLFHKQGYDRLTLDYSTLPRLIEVGGVLRGSEDQRLSVRYMLGNRSSSDVPESFGFQSRNCIFYVDGKVLYAGSEARDSSFVFSSFPEVLGEDAENCSFYFQGVTRVDSLTGPQPFPGTVGPAGYLRFTVNGSDGYNVFMPTDFYKNGNRLFIPKSSKKSSWIKRLVGIHAERYVPIDGKDWMQVRPSHIKEGFFSQYDPVYEEKD